MMRRTVLSGAVAGLILFGSSGLTAQDPLRQALAFHASFDNGLDAAFALGNPKLLTAPTFARRAEATPGLPVTGETTHAKGQGRFGDALRFTTRRKPLVFFEGGPNVPYYDVVAGNNLYYPATTGYDLSTGLGTPNAANIYNILLNSPA